MAMRQRLLAIARQLLGNDDDAVDALQDAFVGLWTRADSLSDERHARGATVISVRNASIDLLRRQPSDAEMKPASSPNRPMTQRIATAKAMPNDCLAKSAG